MCSETSTCWPSLHNAPLDGCVYVHGKAKACGSFEQEHISDYVFEHVDLTEPFMALSLLYLFLMGSGSGRDIVSVYTLHSCPMGTERRDRHSSPGTGDPLFWFRDGEGCARQNPRAGTLISYLHGYSQIAHTHPPSQGEAHTGDKYS